MRRYEGKLLIKPSRAAIKKIKLRLATEMRALRGANAAAVLHTINPIVRGWAAYYRGAVSSATFAALDAYLWQLLFKWARHSHPGKPRHWVADRYFGQFHPERRDRWVFGNRENGASLHKFAWTKIVRHDLVKGFSSPDDPALTEYWAKRRRKADHESPLDRLRRKLLLEQDGRCAACGGLLLTDDRKPQSLESWEHWLTTARKETVIAAISFERYGPAHDQKLRPIHHSCRERATTAKAETCEPQRLA